jgi:hypothetical protein
MAGYLGTKTVLLSTTAANVTGDATISGDLTVDTDTLYVDSTNNRVGIGTDSPSALLTTEVTGSLTLDSNDSDYSAFGLLVHQPSSRATNTVNAAIGFASEGGRKYAAIGAQTYGDLDQTGLNFYVQSNNSGSSANLEEAMRIDSSGNLLVGKTATDSATVGCEQSPFGYQYLTRSSGAAQFIRRNSTDGEAVRFYKDSANVGTISVTGSATAYNTSSDYRLKENITPVQGAADIVKAMQPVTYTFKSDGSWHDGFLAHELQELHPRAVIGSKDAMQDEEYEVTPAVLDEDGAVVTEAVMGTRSVPDYQGVDYSKLTPILTAALQEALNKIDALEAQNATFEARLVALEAV